MVLANAVEQAYDFNPQLATANVRQEVEDAVRDNRGSDPAGGDRVVGLSRRFDG